MDTTLMQPGEQIEMTVSAEIVAYLFLPLLDVVGEVRGTNGTATLRY